MSDKRAIKRRRVRFLAFTPLTPQEAAVILDKGTEYPGISEYTDNKMLGIAPVPVWFETL